MSNDQRATTDDHRYDHDVSAEFDVAQAVVTNTMQRSATALVDELTQDVALTDVERATFWGACERLRRLPEDGSSLSEFLLRLLQLLSEIFAANAAAIWFWNADTELFERKAELGFIELGIELDLTIRADHDALVAQAARHVETILLQPFSALTVQDAPTIMRNPTDAFVLLAPVLQQGQPIAVIELFLGPTPTRGRTPELRQRYREWLNDIRHLLLWGLELRYAASTTPYEFAVARLTAATEQVRLLQDQIREQIQATLQSLAGCHFGSLQANQAIATSVHQMLDSKGLRVRCPECGTAAILRCQNAGNSKSGVFVFDHYLESGRTFHGGRTTFPAVDVIPKPPRRKPS